MVTRLDKQNKLIQIFTNSMNRNMKILNVPGILSIIFSYIITFRDFCNNRVLFANITIKAGLEVLLLLLSITYVCLQIYYMIQKCKEKKIEMEEHKEHQHINKKLNS